MTPAARGAGYSGTPLDRKLGIKPGARVAFLSAPEDFAALIGPLPGVDVRRRLGAELEVIVAFFRRRAELERRLERLLAALAPGGGLWIAWPKRGSGVATDLDESTLRVVVLPAGFVDNKVCAIDATWSGLRFVLRRELR